MTTQDAIPTSEEQTQLRLLESAVARLDNVVLITEAEPIDEPGPRIVFVNEAFERRTGYARHEVIGKSPRFLRGPKTQRTELKRVGAAMKKGQPIRAELINYTKSGETFWLDLDITPIPNETGWFTHWALVERDSSERRRGRSQISDSHAALEERVQQRTSQLEAVNKELEAFSYSVAHDLRGPLGTIDGFTKLLIKSDAERISAKGKHYLSRIQAGTRQMGELIDGLLSLAQLSRKELKFETVDLSEIAEQIEQSHREREPDRVIQVQITRNLLAHGDRILLNAALQNLLGNAWKFTAKHESAHITFGVQVTETGERAYFIKDDGVGFDMACADKLFGAFERLHSPADFSGTGIGLATVKRVIDRHGGRIWAESKVGEGATFYFTLGQQPNLTS